MKGTLLASLGFEDRELATPLHDEIILWLLKNPAVVVGAIEPDPRCGKFTTEIKSTKLEVQATRVNQATGHVTVLGYHDLVIEFVNEYQTTSALHNGYSGPFPRDSRIPTRQRGNSAWHEARVEVKTQIRSIGELIRQLNTVGSNVVVCPDDRFGDVLRSQGFVFIKYPMPIFAQQSLI